MSRGVSGVQVHGARVLLASLLFSWVRELGRNHEWRSPRPSRIWPRTSCPGRPGLRDGSGSLVVVWQTREGQSWAEEGSEPILARCEPPCSYWNTSCFSNVLSFHTMDVWPVSVIDDIMISNIVLLHNRWLLRSWDNAQCRFVFFSFELAKLNIKYP